MSELELKGFNFYMYFSKHISYIFFTILPTVAELTNGLMRTSMFKLLPNDPTRFGIGKNVSVLVSDIVCVVGEGNYAWLYMKPPIKPVLIAITIKTLHESFRSFSRVHKRYLVNLDHMTTFQLVKGRGAIMTLQNYPYDVPIARRRLDDIRMIAQEKNVVISGLTAREEKAMHGSSPFYRTAPQAPVAHQGDTGRKDWVRMT